MTIIDIRLHTVSYLRQFATHTERDPLDGHKPESSNDGGIIHICDIAHASEGLYILIKA